jgi:hypothetical protein
MVSLLLLLRGRELNEAEVSDDNGLRQGNCRSPEEKIKND